MVSSRLPYSCLFWSICRAYADCGWLFLIYLLCSLYQVGMVLLVCPMYALLQVLQVSLYMPLLLWLGLLEYILLMTYRYAAVFINYYSNHPLEHKTAAYRYFINRMYSMTLTNYNQKKEWRLIQNIAQNNNFLPRIIDNLRNTIKKRRLNSKEIERENKKMEHLHILQPCGKNYNQHI